jgi:cyclic dehypoxanthinyl futalosine synthase
VTRLTDKEALELLRSRDLLGVGARAHEVRERLVPGLGACRKTEPRPPGSTGRSDSASSVAQIAPLLALPASFSRACPSHPGGEAHLPDRLLTTFIVDRNINYTNVCVSGCRFCAFHCKPGAADAYVLSREAVHDKIQETLDLGGTAILMQGGLHPDLDITWFEDLFRSIKERFPELTIHSLSAPEIVHIAKVSGLTVPETLRRLKAAGLASLPGGGAEILVDRVREQVAPGKANTKQWLEVMRQAHQQGIAGTATMMFGSVETLEDRVEHMRVIRELQDETGGFRAFIPWSFQSGNTELAGATEQATGVDYLMTLAVSRLYLDNVPHIQASWVTQGLKMGQVALRFGADDLGSTMIEENVVAATGLRVKANSADLVHAIREAGFVPAQRRTDYSLVQVFDEGEVSDHE